MRSYPFVVRFSQLGELNSSLGGGGGGGGGGGVGASELKYTLEVISLYAHRIIGKGH